MPCMRGVAMKVGRLLVLLLLAACTGSKGPAGPAGLDTGTISGTVKNTAGSAITAASVATTPASTTTTTDSSGNFTLASIPIGSYTVTVTASGYQTATLTAVGVAAGATNTVTVTMSPTLVATGTVSGKVLGRQGVAQPSSPVTGAQVCAEPLSAMLCTTSQPDGTFALAGINPGPVYLAVTATGFSPGELKEAAFVSPGSTASGISITLSGSPTGSATYIGASKCVVCHSLLEGGLVTAWQQSAHGSTIGHPANSIALTLDSLDQSGWPAAPATCAAPAVKDSLVKATEPVSGTMQEVLLVRWAANCPGEPQFAMAFDANGNGVVDPGETVIPVQGTIGGVATDAGQCGNGGLLPAAPIAKPCGANFLSSGATSAHGYWQQEYLINIGPGASKPAWVTWDTTNTPQDMLALPLAWNQRTQVWVPGPDYNPTQGGTYAKVCGGCHETGPSITVDANGNVTNYVAGSQNIACERCHGPGSDHFANKGDAHFIINPRYTSAQAQDEMCGQCHSNAVASAQPAGVFDFAWNNTAATGGGNFIPGLHSLADFAQLPTYGDPRFYWPGGIFTSLDHMSYIDVQVSVHNTNPFEKVTCTDCHEAHSVAGGPYQFQRVNAQSGDQYLFQANDAVLRNDVLCLACHATHGDFAAVALEDTVNYHVSQGGAAQKNGTAWTPTADVQAASTSAIAAAVNGHMITRAGMPAFFDPNGLTNGQPVGRCSSCHLAKTAWTATFFSGPDANGKTANVIGDVSSHVFKVAQAQDTLPSIAGAGSWDAIMPNACGSCHTQYRFGL